MNNTRPTVTLHSKPLTLSQATPYTPMLMSVHRILSALNPHRANSTNSQSLKRTSTRIREEQPCINTTTSTLTNPLSSRLAVKDTEVIVRHKTSA